MKKAFSLIELLISLITISVILASLAPIVTHKLKHGGVSIGTKKLSMACPSGIGPECTLCLGNQCVGCPIGCANEFKNLLTCKCEACTQGNCFNCNSDPSRCDRCNSGYGLNMANGTCSACNAPYISTGSTDCIMCNDGYHYQDDNLQSSCKTCDTANGYFPNADRKGCTRKTCSKGYRREGNTCVACSGNTYQGSDGYSGTSCSACGTNSEANSSHTACVSTCVAASSCTGNNYHNGCHCQACGANTTPNADRTACDAVTTPTTCPSTCKTCTSGTANCSSCKDGSYLDGTTCLSCTLKHSKCTKCTSSECTQCSEGYLLKEGTCLKKVTADECSSKFGGFWLSRTSVCVTKRNIGDSANGSTSAKFKEIAIPSAAAVEVVSPGKNCSGINKDRCCWHGTTGDSGANTAGSGSDLTAKLDGKAVSPAYGYSANKRTVCNFAAARELCSKYNEGNALGYWRLPNSSDDLGTMTSPAEFGSAGLQLCYLDDSTHGFPKCTERLSKRFGGNSSNCGGNGCAPHALWTISGNRGNTQVIVASTDRVRDESYGASVRCVITEYRE